MNESNAILAEKFRHDDPQAFATLFGRHHSLVFNVCLRILGHRQDAEDVTQETFSRLAKYLDQWDSRRPLEPWLVRIAGNCSRTFLARRRVCHPLSVSTEPTSEAGRGEQAADSLREELRLALSQLPEKHRRAFELFHEHSLSYAEIAEQLHCPVGTVKTWVHRARNDVIEHLRHREVIQGVGERPGRRLR